MLVGYARTSTLDQVAGLEGQERELRGAGCEKVFSERVSSVAQRAQLEAALDYVREGDALVVAKPDRLARSTADLLGLVGRLERKNVALVVLSMGGQQVDTRTATGKLMLTMLGAIATFERDLMLERQREGIAKAKADGKYKGRAPTARQQARAVHAMKADGMAPSVIAVRLGISRMSVWRILTDGTNEREADPRPMASSSVAIAVTAPKAARIGPKASPQRPLHALKADHTAHRWPHHQTPAARRRGLAERDSRGVEQQRRGDLWGRQVDRYGCWQSAGKD